MQKHVALKNLGRYVAIHHLTEGFLSLCLISVFSPLSMSTKIIFLGQAAVYLKTIDHLCQKSN